MLTQRPTYRSLFFFLIKVMLDATVMLKVAQSHTPTSTLF